MTKYLIIAFAIFAGLTITLSAYSVKLNRDIAKMEERLDVAVSANDSLVKSLENKEQSCKIDDNSATEFLQERGDVEQAGKKDLSIIDSIPRAPKQTSPTESGISNESPEQIVDLDSRMPPDVISVLQSSCNAAKGSPCLSP